MSATLKILVLADSRAVHVERHVAELRRQGCRVRIASLEHGSLHHLHLSRVGPIRALHYVLSSVAIGNVIDRWEPDVLNPHFASGYGFSTAVANRNRQLPIVTHLWGSDILVVPKKSGLHAAKTAYALNMTDAVIADSQYLLDESRRLSRVPDGHVIPWGIERRHLNRFAEDRPLRNPLRVMVPRTHEPVYDNEFLLKSLAPLVAQHRLALTFPDFGSQVTAFRRQIEALQLSDVTLYPRASREDFLDLMASHDIYLSASTSDSSPVSMLEAMAFGLIPVARDHPGVREWLTDEAGFRFAPGNSVELETIMSRLIRGEVDIAELRLHNRTRIEREAVFEDNIARQIDLMRELVSRKAGA